MAVEEPLVPIPPLLMDMQIVYLYEDQRTVEKFKTVADLLRDDPKEFMRQMSSMERVHLIAEGRAIEAKEKREEMEREKRARRKSEEDAPTGVLLEKIDELLKKARG